MAVKLSESTLHTVQARRSRRRLFCDRNIFSAHKFPHKYWFFFPSRSFRISFGWISTQHLSRSFCFLFCETSGRIFTAFCGCWCYEWSMNLILITFRTIIGKSHRIPVFYENSRVLSFLPWPFQFRLKEFETCFWSLPKFVWDGFDVNPLPAVV